jgi:hypothetical protein
MISCIQSRMLICQCRGTACEVLLLWLAGYAGMQGKTPGTSPALIDIKSIVAGAIPSGTRTCKSGNTASTSSDCSISDILCWEIPLMTMACTPVLLLLLPDCCAATACTSDCVAASTLLPEYSVASEVGPMTLHPKWMWLAVATAASVDRSLMR